MANIVSIVCMYCGKPSSTNPVADGGRYFKCESCDAGNVIMDGIGFNDNLTALNTAAGVLFKNGNNNGARSHWTKAVDILATDGTARLGLCLCDYVDNSNNLQLFAKDLQSQIKRHLRVNTLIGDSLAFFRDLKNAMESVQQHMAKDCVFDKKSDHYILAREFSIKTDLADFDAAIDQYADVINNIVQAIGDEIVNIIEDTAKASVESMKQHVATANTNIKTHSWKWESFNKMKNQVLQLQDSHKSGMKQWRLNSNDICSVVNENGLVQVDSAKIEKIVETYNTNLNRALLSINDTADRIIESIKSEKIKYMIKWSLVKLVKTVAAGIGFYAVWWFFVEYWGVFNISFIFVVIAAILVGLAWSNEFKWETIKFKE